MPSIRRFLPVLPVLCLIILAASCRTAPPESAMTTASAPAVTQASPLATATSETPTSTLATATPTSEPGTILLIAPEGAGGTSASEIAAIKSLLEELAADEGLQVVTQPTLTTGDLGKQARRVIVLPPDLGVAALAAAAPQVQFLVIGIPGIEPSSNVSVMGGERTDQQGFLAGLIAAAVTPDWRVGVLSVNDTAAGKAARLGFLNGAVFFCGLCNPANGPIVDYPLAAEFPSSSSPTERQAAADALLGQAVKTLYLSPGTEDPELLSYLAQKEVNVIGSGSPPAGMESRWIASVGADTGSTIREAWPAWISSTGGQAFEAPLALSHANDELFSPGRQAWVDETLADLLAGWIDTGVNPATGEPHENFR